MSSPLRAEPRLFSVPAGAPFLTTLAGALLEGTLIPGFPDASDPLALSAARIFVPTRRAAKALASEIARRQGTAAILPQILPLGSLAEGDDSNLFDPVSFDDFGLADARESISELDRRLVLTKLILNWGSAIRHAICHIDENGRKIVDDTEMFAVLKAPGQAFYLARELATLIDEILIEGVAWERFRALVPDQFDRYWSITLDFLKIVAEHWPHYLQERGLTDGAQRRIDLIRAEAQRLQKNPPAEPMIVAGSTGTNAATAELMATICRLPQGAVVLPGLDMHLDKSAWEMLAPDTHEDRPEHGKETAAGHPQAALARLLKRLGVTRGGVQQLAMPETTIGQRMIFVSEALRPAETTEQWQVYRKANDDGALLDVLSQVTFINAENERMEALAIAVAMREALEDPAQTAALITPDRNLARRVRSELKRWDILIDDSGGESLFSQPAGILANLTLAVLAPGNLALTIMALLQHAHMRLGFPSDEYRRLASLTEITALRGFDPDLGDVEDTIRRAKASCTDPYAHAVKKSIGDDDWVGIAQILQRLNTALAPLRAIKGHLPINSWFSLHADVIQALTDGPEEEGEPADDFAVLFDLCQSFADSDGGGIELDLAGYAALFESVTREAVVRGPQNAHPRLKILGLLEARLLPADIKIIAGLDEGVWPPPAKSDAFLNRPMRATLGLTPPERRIGQTAHDFLEAMGAAKVIVTRARKRGDAPAIPSRLIQRMEALAGQAWVTCSARGERLLRLAEALDNSKNALAIGRPDPKPALELRPQRLSVTEIETWRRDPYAIYAQKILRLQKLEGPGNQQSIADIGSAVHEVLAAFYRSAPERETLIEARERIENLAEDVLTDFRKDETFNTFKWPRVQKGFGAFRGLEQRPSIIRCKSLAGDKR